MAALLTTGAALAIALAIFLGARRWFLESVRTQAAKLANDRIAKLAHDLRQPIQAVELYASALERRLESEECKTIVTRMHACLADAQARVAHFVEGEQAIPTTPHTDIRGASVILVGHRSQALDQAEALFAARGARVERMNDYPSTLLRLRTPVDLVVENAGQGDPRFGIAFASAVHGRAAALVIVDQEDEAIGASLSRNRVACVTADCTGESVVAASEAALRARATSASQSLPHGS